MALQTNAPNRGIWESVKGALGLFNGLNKATTSEKDNFNPTPIGIYDSSYSELEITQLIKTWKERYNKYYNDIEPSQTIAFEYWIGKQRNDESDAISGNQATNDNKIFEAVETFIPIATRTNPDPIVKCDPSEQGQKLASAIKVALIYEADRQKLKKLLKRQIRHWLIYKLGVLKCSYDIILERIETTVINPKRMIMDPDGHWDVSGKFTGDWIGERKQASASRLLELFPGKAEIINLKSGKKKGTKLEYIEWWYKGRDVFYTMDDTVLGKFKNPHWNYDIEERDEVTREVVHSEEGKNFLDKPTDPYVGLSIFSTELQPHDETSLIIQNIPVQDMVNRRWRQIDKNVESMNNGLAVSNAFTAEQAAQAAAALRRGTAIRVPSGKVQDAVMRLPAPGIPGDVYTSLKDARQELSNIFGTSGSTPQGQANEQTARGKILVNQLDASRIGGGITEYLEQVADTVYNYWIQLMFVHYTDEHYYVSAGASDAQTLISIKNEDFLLTKTLDITIKDGSLIPKDPLTQRNEAIDLWSANAIDPLSLYKKLDFPDPVQATNQLILWQMLQKGAIPPQAYLPTFSAGNPPIAQNPALGGQSTMDGGTPQAPGVGDESVNAIGPANQPQGGTPGVTDAVQAKERQLLQSVPVK